MLKMSTPILKIAKSFKQNFKLGPRKNALERDDSFLEAAGLTRDNDLGGIGVVFTPGPDNGLYVKVATPTLTLYQAPY